MTAIKNVRIDWMERFSNDPVFHVELEGETPDYPSPDAPVWVNVGGLHVAIAHDDLVVPYFYSDGKPCEGFAGRTLSGTFTNGTRFEYRGGWSSRAACINGNYRLPRVVDVVIDHCHQSIRALALINWFKANRGSLDWGLAWVNTGDSGPTLQPTRMGVVKNPTQTEVIEHI